MESRGTRIAKVYEGGIIRVKNTTKIKVPKKYHHMIKEIYHDSDGYWVRTAKGFYAYGVDFEAHVIHEDKQADILTHIRMIRKCGCEQCK